MVKKPQGQVRKDRRHDAAGRSAGRPLAARKHMKLVGQFAPRTIAMLRSPAMRVLSLSGRRLLDRLEIEFADHGGTENGSLPLTYADLERFGLDRHAISPAIRECVALGFVEVTEQGRAGNADSRTPSRYRLTYRHTDEAGPTNDWTHIHEDAEALAIAKAAREGHPKQNTSGGKPHLSVGETHTEKALVPVGKTHTTGSVGKPPLPSISWSRDEQHQHNTITTRKGRSP